MLKSCCIFPKKYFKNGYSITLTWPENKLHDYIYLLPIKRIFENYQVRHCIGLLVHNNIVVLHCSYCFHICNFCMCHGSTIVYYVCCYKLQYIYRCYYICFDLFHNRNLYSWCIAENHKDTFHYDLVRENQYYILEQGTL